MVPRGPAILIILALRIIRIELEAGTSETIR